MNQTSANRDNAAQMSSRKILITGVAGFIGFHLARYMLNAGWVVAASTG